MKHFFLACFLCLLSTVWLNGCVVDNEEYETARRDRDNFLNELKLLNEDNENLNREISKLYIEHDVLAGKLSMHAAVDFHGKYISALLNPPLQPDVDGRQANQQRSNRPRRNLSGSPL